MNDPGRLGEGQARELIRQPVREQFEENHTQGVHVRPLIDQSGIGGDLLRAHVRQCADDIAHFRPSGALPVGVSDAGHAEIEDLGLPRLIHQDVPGLEVAVNDAPVVRMLNGVAHLREQFDAGGHIQATIADVPVQGLAADQFHCEVGLLFFGQPGLVDLRDAGMVQAAQDLGLIGEPLDESP